MTSKPGLENKTSDTWHKKVSGLKPTLDPVISRSKSANNIDLETGEDIFGDSSMLNRILREALPKNDDYAYDIVPAVTNDFQVDHFFEVQHVVVLIFEYCNYTKTPVLDLPLSLIVKISGWINDPNNTFRLSKKANQDKKMIGLDAYDENQFIENYLKTPVGDGKYRVKDHIALLLDRAYEIQDDTGLLVRIAQQFDKALPMSWRD